MYSIIINMFLKKLVNKITDKDDPKEENKQPAQSVNQSQRATTTYSKSGDQRQFIDFQQSHNDKAADSKLQKRGAEANVIQDKSKDQSQSVAQQIQSNPLMSMDNRRRPQTDFMQDLMGLRSEDNQDNDDYVSDNFFNEYERKPKSTLQYPSNRIATVIDESDLNVLSQSAKQSTLKPQTEEQPKPIEVKAPVQTQIKSEQQLKPVVIPTYPKVQQLQPVAVPPTKANPSVVVEQQISRPKIEEPIVQQKDKIVQDQTQIKVPVQPLLARPTPTNRNRASHRVLDLGLDDDDGDDFEPHEKSDLIRNRGRDGHSAALQRIIEKRQRGTMLPSQTRPIIEDETSTRVNEQPSSKQEDQDLELKKQLPVARPTLVKPLPQVVEKIEENDAEQEPDFVDFNKRRQEAPRLTTEQRRVAIREKINLPNRLEKQKQEELERNSSDSDLTDKRFEDNCDIDSDEIEMTIQKLESRNQMNAEFGKQWVQDTLREQLRSNSNNKEQQSAKQTVQQESPLQVVVEDEDFLKLIEVNENMFRQYGEKKLKDQRNLSMQSAKSLAKFKENAQMQSVLSEPKLLRWINIPQTHLKTCIAIQSSILLVGTSSGILYAFDIKQEKALGQHKEDGKDFIDNAITSIDIHYRRPEYCVIGFQKGQLALINLNQINKTVKLIKDHHNVPIVTVKFCDWLKEKPHFSKGASHKCKECENVGSWMFISCDQQGKVVQNTVSTIGFFNYASDYVLIDPAQSNDSQIFQVVTPRMSSRDRPSEIENDTATVVALGSQETVVVWVTPEKGLVERLVLEKPVRYASHNIDDAMPVMSQLPILAWGFGKTPRYNFQIFPLLAIAWGPIIQLLVFKDITGSAENTDFELDGHYIIAPEKSKGVKGQIGLDTQIQSLHFIDESLLIAVTSSQEIRVMLTYKFKERVFEQPQHLQEIRFDEIDSRCKMMQIGSPLTQQQIEIEIERKHVLLHPLCDTHYSQIQPQQINSVSVFDDSVQCLTSAGIYSMHHLNWLESLGNLESSVVSGSWIEVFAKALEIYTGKVKGLRMNEDDESKESMRDQLKQMIDKQVVQIIVSWKNRAEINLKSGTMNQMQVVEDLNSKFQTLIRIVIEFCVEIQEPVFLFDTLLKKFHSEGKSMLFAEELKPYILSGHFAECIISEEILSEQILQHHQKVYQESYEQILNSSSNENVSAAISPAENFEKILINFRFDSCSKEYKLKLIDYCRSYGLTSALMYMCLNCFDEQGPIQALTQLKDFYLDTLSNEMMGESILQREDLQALYTMPANFFDRIQLEKSSCYLGLKLMWSARLFLLGKKFPRGFFYTQEWHILCHDIIELITQDDFIQLLTEIDAGGYFQIISLVFKNPSSQYKFIELGRPATIQTNTNDIKISVTHEMIVQRISSYFNQASMQTDPSQIHYLCFIASIAGSYEHINSTNNERLYYTIVEKLLKHSDLLINYNKDLLKNSPNCKSLLQRLQGMGNCDDQKEILLSESMLLMLIERSKSIIQNKKELDTLIKAVKQTDFHNVKLVLFELNDDYLQCLQLFMERNRKRGSQMKEAITWKGKQDGFKWIQEKHEQLEQLVIETKGDIQKSQLADFEKEVLQQAAFLVNQNMDQTIQLCEAVFKSNHLDFLKEMQQDKDLQYKYIKQLLELKRTEIKDSLIQSGQTSSTNQQFQSIQQKQKLKLGEHKKWNQILTMHLRLVCELEPENVTYEVEKIIKDNFYPMEECLKICVEFKQIEASALLNKKIGNYESAITLYLQILRKEINYERLKKELYYLDKENKRHIEKERQLLFAENQAKFKLRAQNTNLVDLKSLVAQSVKTLVQTQNISKDRRRDLYRVWVEKFGKNIDLLDRSLEKMQNICKAHPKEVLLQSDESWQQIITFLFSVLFHPLLRKKSYCKRYLKLKMVEFCRCILPHVSFFRIIYFSSDKSKQLRFKAVKELVNDVFEDKSQEFEMCVNANTTQARDLLILQTEVQNIYSGGVSFYLGSLYCGICEKVINEKQYTAQIAGTQAALNQSSMIFDCLHEGTSEYNHSFHGWCLKKFQSDENGLTKKAAKEQDFETKLRCPCCYPKNHDVLFQDTSNAKTRVKEDKAEGSDSDSEQKAKKPSDGSAMQAIIAKRALLKQKKYMQREKQMKRFDEELMMQECLSSKDFKM